MKLITVPKIMFNPIPLPGMGRSIELNDLTEQDVIEIRNAFARDELYVEFVEEPGETLRVKQLWPNPHALQITLFV